MSKNIKENDDIIVINADYGINNPKNSKEGININFEYGEEKPKEKTK